MANLFKRLAIGAGLAVASNEAIAQTAVGMWAQIDDRNGKVRSHVEIFEESGRFFGRVARIFPKKKEASNPICEKCPGDKRGKPVLGLVFLEGLERDGLDYRGGQLLDPESGNVYKGSMKLSPDGQSLTLRGYVLVSALGRSQTWRRVR